MALILTEPFNDTTTNGWVVSGTNSITAARTGNGLSLSGTGGSARYTIPVPSESNTVTVGFAFRISNAAGTRAIFRLESDSGATSHVHLAVLTDGTAELRLGGTGGALLAASAVGVIPINTYMYLELQAYLHDTTGYVILTKDGIEVASAINIDTKNAGTKTVFDRLCLLSPASGIGNIFDDLYLRNDSVAQGDPVSGGDARLARIDLRSLVIGDPIARMANISVAGLFPLNITEAQIAQMDMRALIELIAEGTFVNLWDGSEFVEAPTKLWTGSEYVDAEDLKTWNGTAFV